MGQFSNPMATHPHTNEVEVPPPPPGKVYVPSDLVISTCWPIHATVNSQLPTNETNIKKRVKLMHFDAVLRKIKSTLSRFSSL